MPNWLAISKCKTMPAKSGFAPNGGQVNCCLTWRRTPAREGEGRPRKDGTKIRRSVDTTAYPPKLEEIGVSKDQTSKWQRLALLVDESTFEKALVQAREKNGELTNAALLREIREIVTPTEVLTDPDVNVIASELIRDIESASRREKLETAVRLRKRLNPTLTKKLVLALTNSANHLARCEKQLSKDFEDFPANGKAFQRVIRERMAEQPDPLLAEKVALAADFTMPVCERFLWQMPATSSWGTNT